MASSDNEQIGSLQVDSVFNAFVTEELLPAIGLDADQFWMGVEAIIDDLTPVNRDLLAKRDALQAALDAGEAVQVQPDTPLATFQRIGILHFQTLLASLDEKLAS